jgi:hypothetical protein
MPRMTDRELVALVDSEFSTAMGAPDAEISAERALAWNYYMSKKLGNEVEGQSSVVTSDVADVVDGIMPSLLRLFTTADNLVSFDPVGTEDVDQAAQESDFVNYVFFKQNNAFLILYNWFFDALVQKNGIVKCWVEEKERVSTETYSNLTQEQLFALLEDEEIEPVERSEFIDEATGMILHDIQVKRVTTRKAFRVENVPPEEYRISADARSLDPNSARMVGQEREITRSDLLAMGFDSDLVDRLPAHNGRNTSNEELAKYDRYEEEIGKAIFDKSQDLIEVREAYILVDYEGKGRAELRQVFTSNGFVLSNEPADCQPFHVISPQPLPHKHFGRATAEKVMDVQKVSTTLLRQTLDNLYHSNNPGHAVNERMIGDNTLDDLLTRRVGGVTRFSGPIGEAWSPMTVPFTAGASFDMLAYFDKIKRDRTGVNSDAEGLKPDQLKHIQQSVMGQSMDMARMKIEAIARIFAETGIKSLFMHLHELVAKHMDRAQVVRLRNEFVEVDPTRWRTRFDMTVNIGLGIANKESAMMMLERVVSLQDRIIAGGGLGLLVTPQNIYNTAAEIVKAAGLKSADMYFNDPSTVEPQPEEPDPQQQMAEAQIALQQQMAQIEASKVQLREMEIAIKHQEENARLAEQREKREDDLMVKVQEMQNKIMEMELKYNRDLPGGM